ncbi:MAG: heme-binding domain-containing protein [Caldilineales bacterium]|nr:heme-binding domain-containing protein [Caldilineales bacterium]MCW5859353.1 heme-binding domain-containing protein [Caldilineales bacterium]
MQRIILWIVVAVVAGFVLIQILPFGRNHTNPPVVAEPQWDGLQTRALAARACFDCHSNESVWPWYSNIAPVSWLITHDVDEGRSKLNFSEWGVVRAGRGSEGEEGEEGEGRPGGGERGEGDDVVHLVRSGEMPPWYFVLLHPNAKLTDAEKEALIQGLQASGVQGN